MSDHDSSKKKLKPTFKVPEPPLNPRLPSDADIIDETTRRIGVVPPRFNLNQSFEPMQKLPIPSFQQPDSQQPNTIKKETPIHTRPAEWNLREAPTLPEYHPLERTAVFVPHSGASAVAGRISNILRERSIECVYNNSKAKVKCTTPDQVDFRIRLYRGRNQYSHGIIAEVQRRFGASLTFHADTTAILDAAEGKMSRRTSSSSLTLNVHKIAIISDSEDDFDAMENKADYVSSLQIVSKMLLTKQYDVQNLALQTMSSLIDPTKMGQTTAFKVSTEMLQPDNHVGQTIVSLVVDSNVDPEENFGLRVMAMSVLSNAIQATNGNISTMLREKLKPVLIQELKNANTNPQMAYLAAKCIEPLIRTDTDDSQSDYYTDSYSALQDALTTGQARHAALARQAERCIQKINSP